MTGAISQSERANETQFSLDHHFPSTVKNRFLSVSFRSPKARVIRKCQGGYRSSKSFKQGGAATPFPTLREWAELSRTLREWAELSHTLIASTNC